LPIKPDELNRSRFIITDTGMADTQPTSNNHTMITATGWDPSDTTDAAAKPPTQSWVLFGKGRCAANAMPNASIELEH